MHFKFDQRSFSGDSRQRQARQLTYDHELGHVFSDQFLIPNDPVTQKVVDSYHTDLKTVQLSSKVEGLLRESPFLSYRAENDPRTSHLTEQEKMDGYMHSRDEVVAESFQLFMQKKHRTNRGEKPLSYEELVRTHVEDRPRQDAQSRKISKMLESPDETAIE